MIVTITEAITDEGSRSRHAAWRERDWFQPRQNSGHALDGVIDLLESIVSTNRRPPSRRRWVDLNRVVAAEYARDGRRKGILSAGRDRRKEG